MWLVSRRVALFRSTHPIPLFSTLNRGLALLADPKLGLGRQGKDRSEAQRAEQQRQSVYSSPNGDSPWSINAGTSDASGSWAIGTSQGPETTTFRQEDPTATADHSGKNLVTLPNVNKPADLLRAMEAHPADALELLLAPFSSSSPSSSYNIDVTSTRAAWTQNFARMNGAGLSSFMSTVVYGLCNLLDPLLFGDAADTAHSPLVYRDLTLATIVLSVALDASRLRQLDFDAEDQALLFHCHLALSSLGSAIDDFASTSSPSSSAARLARSASFLDPSTGASVSLSSLRLPRDIADACLKQHNLSLLAQQPVFDLLSLTMRRSGLRYSYRQPPSESKCGYLNWLVLPVSQRYLDEAQNDSRKAEVLGGGLNPQFVAFDSSGPRRSLPIRRAVLDVAGEWNLLPSAYLGSEAAKHGGDEANDHGREKGNGNEDAIFLSLAQRLKNRNLAVLDGAATVLISRKERQEFLSPSLAASIDIDRGLGADAAAASSFSRVPASRSNCSSLAELLGFISLTLAGPDAFARQGGKVGQPLLSKR